MCIVCKIKVFKSRFCSVSKDGQSVSLDLIQNSRNDSKMEYKAVVRSKKRAEARMSRRKKNHLLFFSSCSSSRRFSDQPLCATEIFLVISLGFLFLHQLWEFVALGSRYFKELESWFKLLIFSLALTSMFFMEDLEVLNVIASAAICLAWIEVIFMIGRYPFLGGRFSIMFYSITKRIIQGAVSFIIMIVAFGFAFFVISFGSDSEQFQNPGKSLLKIIVMILGEFEFDTLYQDSDNSSTLSLVFTMTLLIGLIIFGSLIMINLIIAIIVSDVKELATAAKQQVLINKVPPILISIPA